MDEAAVITRTYGNADMEVREKLRGFEIDLRKTNSVAGESGGIGKKAFHFDSDILRNPVYINCIWEKINGIMFAVVQLQNVRKP